MTKKIARSLGEQLQKKNKVAMFNKTKTRQQKTQESKWEKKNIVGLIRILLFLYK